MRELLRFPFFYIFICNYVNFSDFSHFFHFFIYNYVSSAFFPFFHFLFIITLTQIFSFFSLLTYTYVTPQIRYGSLERLLERLLDVRFLSIDFLNTFLITYRVFTSATTLLDTLVQFYYTRSTKDGSPLSDGYQPNSKKTRSVSLPTEALSYIADRRLGKAEQHFFH